MTAPEFQNWATRADFIGKSGTLYDEEPALFERSVEQATAILDRLSGHQTGLATITETLCPILLCDRCANTSDPVIGHGTADNPGPNLKTGKNIGYEWFQNFCAPCKKSCRDRGPEWAPLTYGPVHTVELVELDGEELTLGEDFIMSQFWMVRTDGRCWPTVTSLCCSDPCRGESHPCDWKVTYRYGVDPDVSARIAVAALATELAYSYLDRPCKLPERLISYSQGGMDFRILDRMDFLSKGRTGIYQVDLWLESVNPQDYRGSMPTVVSAEGMARVGGSKQGSGWT